MKTYLITLNDGKPIEIVRSKLLLKHILRFWCRAKGLDYLQVWQHYKVIQLPCVNIL